MAGAAAAILGCKVTLGNAGHVWQNIKIGVWVTLTIKHITPGPSVETELRRSKIKNFKPQLFLVTLLWPPCNCLIMHARHNLIDSIYLTCPLVVYFSTLEYTPHERTGSLIYCCTHTA